VTLHDAAYNPDRNIATGNPNEDLVAEPMKRGVRVELCGVTASSQLEKRRPAPEHQATSTDARGMAFSR